MPHVINTRALIKPHFLRNVLDVLIIGAGPAGLSAALALGRVRRSAIIFDYSEYRNSVSLHSQTFSTPNYASSTRADMIEELRAKYKTILFSSTAAKSVRERGMVFEVEDVTGRCWKGRKVILATGTQDILPEIPGYQEAWGKTIIDCSQCHGLKSTNTITEAAALITSDDASSIDSAVLSAYLARQHTPGITMLTNGLRHLEQHPKIRAAKKQGFEIDHRAIKIFRHVGTESTVDVEFADGTKAVYGLIAYKPKTVIEGPFAQQLDLEITPGGQIVIEDDFRETSLRGVFAAGECATAVKLEAAGVCSGQAAGIGANLQIAEDDMSW
ncbi:Thioredoxin reductase [Fusarium austroafricanum]|uniref:Thioredoxin reductase n=1 Tax=Fusarium austroafricanum TaxID=2364996 RepID=A0A8H4NZX5_9HYPO|nr:Thioredoxin reductase [Fusarium austroafricanum]